uniref:Uncharacterized protein n=1 Tax=Pseudo-nitzschia australis TaxID=44445 RepID=A0A7S4ATZ8_9STRA
MTNLYFVFILHQDDNDEAGGGLHRTVTSRQLLSQGFYSSSQSLHKILEWRWTGIPLVHTNREPREALQLSWEHIYKVNTTTKVVIVVATTKNSYSNNNTNNTNTTVPRSSTNASRRSSSSHQSGWLSFVHSDVSRCLLLSLLFVANNTGHRYGCY